MEEIKYFKVEVPKGYEIDKENSTFEHICFKKIEQEVRTWDDLIGKSISTTFCFIDTNGGICTFHPNYKFDRKDKNIFIDEKHAKSALAMAQISQLMPYYGGAITDEEWKDIYTIKYIICRTASGINSGCYTFNYDFLAFHTEEQRDNFLKYNERLVKDYLMLD